MLAVEETKSDNRVAETENLEVCGQWNEVSLSSTPTATDELPLF